MNARRGSSTDRRMIATPGGDRNMLVVARLIAAGEGFCMVRRPGVTTRPFVITEQEWAEAPLPDGK